MTAILARIAENAQKLALVSAVGVDPGAPSITATDADWAIRLIRHFASCTMVAVERHVADNETERNHKRMLEIIRASGKAGLTKNEFIRKTQFVDKRQREEILADAGRERAGDAVHAADFDEGRSGYRAVGGRHDRVEFFNAASILKPKKGQRHEMEWKNRILQILQFFKGGVVGRVWDDFPRVPC